MSIYFIVFSYCTFHYTSGKTSGCAGNDLIWLFMMNTEIVSVHLLLVIGRSEQFSAECCNGQNSEDCRSPAETAYWVSVNISKNCNRCYWDHNRISKKFVLQYFRVVKYNLVSLFASIYDIIRGPSSKQHPSLMQLMYKHLNRMFFRRCYK